MAYDISILEYNIGVSITVCAGFFILRASFAF